MAFPTLVAIKGGMGNQLFQIAAALYRTGGDFSSIIVDDGYFTNDSRHGGNKLPHLFPLVNFKCVQGGRFRGSFASFYTDTSPTLFIENLNQLELPLALSGYFQNTKYVEPVIQRMRRSLRWSTSDLVRVRERIGLPIRPNHLMLSLHWRGGDYRLQENRSTLGLVSVTKLFEIATRLVLMHKRDGTEVTVVCFSDEPDIFTEMPMPWQSGSALAKGFDRSPQIAEFCVLLASDLIVCSNSTYSLWASYLSPIVQDYWLPDPWSVNGRIQTSSLLGPSGKTYESALS